MIQGEERLPPKPYNARTETNAEVLRQLSRDLTSIDDLELTATDGYRMFRHAGGAQPSWGYCLECARVGASENNLILFRKDKDVHEESSLEWIPLSDCYTTEQSRNHDVSYNGPSEEVLHAILELFRDVFEFAFSTNWSYEERMKFYISIPFEELPTLRAVRSFRRTFFSNPVFEGFTWTFPEIRDIEG